MMSLKNVIKQKSCSIPVVQDCDVCVLGGGCTGVFAAVRAAQLGAKVALVEKQNGFGGVATSGLVSHWHSLRSRDGSVQIIAGLTQEVLKHLEKINAVAHPHASHYVLNTSELKIELDRLVVQHGIRPYLHTYYAALHHEGGRPAAVFVENKNGRQAIVAKVFVDATGDGDLAKDAGISYAIREGLQPPTTCAAISGLPDSIQELIREHGAGFGLAVDHGWDSPLTGAPEVNMCAYTHVFNADASDATQLTNAEIEGRRQIRAYMDVARAHGGLHSDPCLLALASSIGIRETRSFEANYRLTEEDVLNCRRFPDAIANGSYHIDVHDPETGLFRFKELLGDYYQIPLRTMISASVPNIVLAGRMISTDRGAFGAVRVMVNLNQTGEAAGVLAALAAAKGVPVNEIEVQTVRQHLMHMGAVIL